MIFRTLKHLLSLVFLFPALLAAQPEPKFTAFHGTVYEMPPEAQGKGFAAGLETFDSIGHIVLPKLAFLEDSPQKNFPSVGRAGNFGFYLEAGMTIDTPGCYTFTIGSDDGSILWLDGSVLLENDKMHRWRAVKNTVSLAAGKYPLNLWYYNGMGPCGIGLHATYAGPEDSCAKETEGHPAAGVSLFFASDEYAVTARHDSLLNALIGNYGFSAGGEVRITVTGFADPLGGSTYNEQLSLKRAEAVANALRRLVPQAATATYLVQGMGECPPEEDEAGCRRVGVALSSAVR